MDDHRVPVLAGEELVVAPVEGDVGVTQAQVVDGSVGATGEVALDIGGGLCSQHLGAGDFEPEAGGDGQHVGLPAVVEVVAEAVT